GLASAVQEFSKEKKLFSVLVGMERLDRKACEHLAQRLSTKPPIFVSDEYDMYDLVSILRNASILASSRFHAIVTSMPGLVPSCGITMDERIRNLMHDRDHTKYLLEVTDEDLNNKLLIVLRNLWNNSDAVKNQIGLTIPKQLKLMGEMGIDFLDEV